MTIFLSGGAKNGKSGLAQSLAVALGEKRYYVATMISTGQEDDARIRRHIEDRAGLGFQTVECFRNVLTCLDNADADGTFLVDSVTSLMQNALFSPENNYEPDLSAARACADALVEFAGRVKNVIFVSDFIYSDCTPFSETTQCYRRCLADADRRLAAVCDTVAEVCAGQVFLYKGELPL